MNVLGSVATKYPFLFVLGLTLAWFVLLMVFMGIASSALRRPYGDATTVMISRFVVAACALALLWGLGWLEASGVAHLGRWPIWLLALGGLIYFVGASLYAFYGKVAFDVSSLFRLPAARTAVLAHFAAGLNEEIVFRGLVLYALIRVWGHTRLGLIGSVLLTSLLFALVHLTQIFTYRVSLPLALLLTVQVCIVSIWWGALALLGGSIWPAVILHFVVNAVVAVQGLTVPMIEPDILAYRRLLWFSIPLGLLGIGLLILAALRPIVPKVP